MSNIFITTPIYYANGLPHLGHLYTTTVADMLTLHKRQRGVSALLLTGTDEHGVNIQRAAELAGRSPQEQVDFISAGFVRMFKEFGLTHHDIFMRTTDAGHKAGAQALWKAIASRKTPKGNDNIYKGFYEGMFCAPCAAFKSEEETIKREDGVVVCSDHERPLESVSEESYFFRLSDYQNTLIDILEREPQRIRPEARRNEVLSFVRRGLQDLSISREKASVSWGVPVPDDDNHVMYVWLDALSNYITGLGYGSDDTSRLDRFWESAVHLVGKDILRFHTVYWWSFLIGAGLSLPRTVFSHGMWLDSHGRKMGKTLGNAIELDDLRSKFPIDAIRYFLLRDMVFGQDGNFGYLNLTERVNADLANGLGNLAARTASMINKYRSGVAPTADPNILEQLDPNFKKDLEEVRDEFIRRFDAFEFSQGLEAVWRLIKKADLMISEQKPWNLAKDAINDARLDAVLRNAWEVLRWVVTMTYPVMPESCLRLATQLGFEIGNPETLEPSTDIEARVSEKSEIVFPRLNKESIIDMTQENDSREPVDEAKTGEPAKQSIDQATEEFITIDDFLKVQLRIGEIKVAERIPNADKLLRFEIDLGEGRNRQILAGLAEFYDPETLVGRRVVVVANLKPRKMRGLDSEGMICAASLEDSDDKPAIATFIESVSIGARLK